MEIGEHIGKYIITEVLHGGMSEVYRVTIDGASIRFVIKRLKTVQIKNPVNYFNGKCVFYVH